MEDKTLSPASPIAHTSCPEEEPVPIDAAVNIPTPSSPLPLGGPITDPIALLHEIGNRYVNLLESGDAGKWRQLERDMMANIHILVPQVIPLKDFLATVADCDERAKGSSKHIGKTASEALREFLNTGAVDGKPLDISPQFSVQEADEPVSAQQAGLLTAMNAQSANGQPEESNGSDNPNTVEDKPSI